MINPNAIKDFVRAVHATTLWSKSTAARFEAAWASIDPESRSELVWDTQLWGRPKVMLGLSALGVDLSRWEKPSPKPRSTVDYLLKGKDFEGDQVLSGVPARKLAFWSNVSVDTHTALTNSGLPTGSEKEFSYWLKSALDHGWEKSAEYVRQQDPVFFQTLATTTPCLLLIGALCWWNKGQSKASREFVKKVGLAGASFDEARDPVFRRDMKDLSALDALILEVREAVLDHKLPPVSQAPRSAPRGPRF